MEDWDGEDTFETPELPLEVSPRAYYLPGQDSHDLICLFVAVLKNTQPVSTNCPLIGMCFLSIIVDHSLHPELSSCLRQEGSFTGLSQVVQCQPGPSVSGRPPPEQRHTAVVTAFSSYAHTQNEHERQIRPKGRVKLSVSVSLCAEERHLLLPGFSLILGADQTPRQEAILQTHHQPARWLQYVQTAASGGPVHCCI